MPARDELLLVEGSLRPLRRVVAVLLLAQDDEVAGSSDCLGLVLLRLGSRGSRPRALGRRCRLLRGSARSSEHGSAARRRRLLDVLGEARAPRLGDGLARRLRPAAEHLVCRSSCASSRSLIDSCPLTRSPPRPRCPARARNRSQSAPRRCCGTPTNQFSAAIVPRILSSLRWSAPSACERDRAQRLSSAARSCAPISASSSAQPGCLSSEEMRSGAALRARAASRPRRSASTLAPSPSCCAAWICCGRELVGRQRRALAGHPPPIAPASSGSSGPAADRRVLRRACCLQVAGDAGVPCAVRVPAERRAACWRAGSSARCRRSPCARAPAR